MTFAEYVTAWLTPPRFPAPAFPVEPERFRLRLPAVPLPGFPADRYPQVLGANQEVQCYRWPGSGPTVLLAHGWGGGGAQFAVWFKPLLEAGFSVLAYDAPGHGASEGTYSSAPANAAVIRALAQRYALHGIVAHSLGAIATGLALADGAHCNQLIFLAPCCFVMDDLVAVGRQHGIAPEDEAALVAYFASEFSSDLTVLTALERIAEPPPLTIFHDRADTSVPYAEAETLHAHWPGSELIETPRVGHTRILLSKNVLQKAVSLLCQMLS